MDEVEALREHFHRIRSDADLHAPRRGYAIERCWSDEECSAAPGDCLELAMTSPRFITNRQHAERLVQRWNRRFARR